MKKPRHLYIEEAGDTTFYGKGRKPLMGSPGVSKIFLLGLLKLKDDDQQQIRQRTIELQKEITASPYFNDIPSIKKQSEKDGYFLHASKDPPEVRLKMYELIKNINCEFKVVVARKEYGRFAQKHNSNHSEFYADLLSHLLKDELALNSKLILNVARRGASTKNKVLDHALHIAAGRFAKNTRKEPATGLVSFNVQNPIREPILTIVDYLNWAVQRVFEMGETRYYEFIKDKIVIVKDLYDKANFENKQNHYGPSRPLTSNNRIDPPSH